MDVDYPGLEENAQPVNTFAYSLMSTWRRTASKGCRGVRLIRLRFWDGGAPVTFALLVYDLRSNALESRQAFQSNRLE